MDYISVGNSLGMWLAVIPGMAVIFIQAILIMRKAKEASPLVSLTHEERNVAIRSGLITAIGPSVHNVVIIISLAAVLGTPIAWQRTSIIASATTELQAATFAAEAMGLELGGAGYDLKAYCCALFVMALNGCGWMIMCLLFTDKMNLVADKITGGSKTKMAVFSTSSIVACMAYMESGQIVKKSTPTMCAAIASFAAEFICDQLAKKYPKLKQWNLCIAMLTGMFVGALLQTMAAE